MTKTDRNIMAEMPKLTPALKERLMEMIDEIDQDMWEQVKQEALMLLKYKTIKETLIEYREYDEIEADQSVDLSAMETVMLMKIFKVRLTKGEVEYFEKCKKYLAEMQTAMKNTGG